MTVVLELYTATVSVAATNSTTARWCLTWLMGGVVGVILFVFKDEFNAFAESEIWYVLVWMFVEQEMWFVNASARSQYNTHHDENNQRWMHNKLTETQRLGIGLSKEERALLVGGGT